MAPSGNWRRSSYSGGGDGNNCVEIANLPTIVAIRDSKDPARATIGVPVSAFAPFIEALKASATSGLAPF
ncbi:DUF397 domain-containing protein [Streptomyces canus]|uniref:DUF397 domain-containing protein n=1 Tax=Streptomyces canus TaxID=58343 RepID=UPI0033A51038